MNTAPLKCQVCHKQTVAFKKIKVQDMVWHKKCCQCVICTLQLSSKTIRQANGKAYCVKHCPKPSTNLISRNQGERNTTEERLLPYFHGEAGRQEIERRLIRNGDFLIRWSTNESAYIVSVRHTGGVLHARIPRTGRGFLFHEEVISTMRAWTERHMQSKTPVVPRTTFFLINPVNRPSDVKSREPPAVARRKSSPEGLLQRMKSLRPTCYDGIVQISLESICKVQADVIVNSVALHMDLSTGALARAIIAAGGPGIQTELNEHRQRSTKAPTFGDVIVTRGYNLPCKRIFHTILKSWGDVQNVVQELSKILRKVFELADEKKLTSIAIPPIGTGGLGYPKQVVAQVLYSEAADYLDYHPESSISKIIFAVNGEHDLYEIFEKLHELEDSDGDQDYTTIIEPTTNNENDEFYEKLNSEYAKMTTIYTRLSNVGEQNQQIFPYPKTWSTSKSSQKPYERVELDPNSTEYADVIANMIASDGETHVKLISKVERIENGHSYQLYEHMRRLMIEANSKDVMNERVLWHGTTAEAVDNIIMSGFNRSYAGAHATYYGIGAYFAVNFSYSAQAIYSPPDNSGLKWIFQCRVLTGKCCLGHKALLEPDFIPGESRRCDSAVDSLEDPSIFVIFKDFAAYPEYLISFYDDTSPYVLQDSTANN